MLVGHDLVVQVLDKDLVGAVGAPAVGLLGRNVHAARTRARADTMGGTRAHAGRGGGSQRCGAEESACVVAVGPGALENPRTPLQPANLK